jgi:hypothetical protein
LGFIVIVTAGKTSKEVKTMPHFFIESRHTPAECARGMDDLAHHPDTLSQFSFGCLHGNHTAWALVDATSESAARSLVPAVVRNKARVVQVDKFTPEQIKDLLKAHA